MIDLDEERKRSDDPVAQAQAEELLPDPQKLDEAAEHDKEPERAEKPEDQHVELPPEELARMAGIQPQPAAPTAATPETASAAPAAPTAAPAEVDAVTGASPAPAAPEAAADPAAAAHELGAADAALAARAPDSEQAEDQAEEAIPAGEFGPHMAVEQKKEEEAQPEPSAAPVDGKAALAAAAGAAAGVAAAAHEEEKAPAASGGGAGAAHEHAHHAPHHAAATATPAASPAPAPVPTTAPAPAATADADGFAGMRDLGGHEKWNENAYYKKDKTTGFDVGGSHAVTLGKGPGGGASAADAAVYATAAVETSGTYDAVQTYDKGILSFGIMQWTLHQGSLMKFLDYLKTKCGPDGAAAFAEHFGPLGIDVHGDTLIVGGAAIKPDDAGRKQIDRIVRADKDTTRRWVTAFHAAGADPRVARAQWVYTKKQYEQTAGNSLDKYVKFARKKGYAPKHAGAYKTPSFWCRDPDAAALFFSMTTNNPGYSYYGVIKAADLFMDGRGADPKQWPSGWEKEFTSIYAALLPSIIGSWKERVAKTLQHLHLAQEGKTAEPTRPRGGGHAAARPQPPAPVAQPRPPAPAEVKHAAQAPQPAPEQHSGLSWLSDVLTRKVVRGLEEASTAVKHFLGIATTGSPQHHDEAKAPAPPETKQLAAKIEKAAPAHAPASKASRDKQVAGLIPSARLHQKGGKGKKAWELTDAQFHFKQQVYDAAVGAKVAKGQQIFSGIPDEDLTEVGGKKIRKDVAPFLTQLMGGLHDAWQAAKHNGDDGAKRVTEIAISSGYRDPEKDFGLWDDYFQKYYDATAAARKATGDEHGPDAVKYLVKYIGGKKAPPGFSNHTGGTAVDLQAIVDGQWLGADASHQKRWFDSWIWKWLHENAKRYGFHPIPTEAWHWEYHG